MTTDTKYPPTPPIPSFVGRNRLQQKAAWEGALRAYVLVDRASRTPEPVGVPAGYFIDTSAPGQPPHYAQVAAEHSQDPDTVALFAAPVQQEANEELMRQALGVLQLGRDRACDETCRCSLALAIDALRARLQPKGKE